MDLRPRLSLNKLAGQLYEERGLSVQLELYASDAYIDFGLNAILFDAERIAILPARCVEDTGKGIAKSTLVPDVQY